MKILGTLLLGIFVGFASATAIQSLLDAGARSKTKRTAGDCRTISTALEAYRASTGRYPPLDGNVEHLVPYLVPLYLKQFPTRDMSGEPFLVVMNGSRVAVIAMGKYGVVAEDGEITRGEVWSNPRQPKAGAQLGAAPDFEPRAAASRVRYHFACGSKPVER